MKRGAVHKGESDMLTVWVPKPYFPLIQKGVQKTDTDRSKFVRAAIREKLARHGILMSEEAV
jgi:hypothetical protein